jgi:hypothetical protein
VRSVDVASVAHGACAGQGEGAEELTEHRATARQKIATARLVCIDGGRRRARRCPTVRGRTEG